MPQGKHVLSMPKGKHIFSTVKVDEKGQIVIPKKARSLFNINQGDTLPVLGDEENGIVISKPDVVNNIALQIFNKMNMGSEE